MSISRLSAVSQHVTLSVTDQQWHADIHICQARVTFSTTHNHYHCGHYQIILLGDRGRCVCTSCYYMTVRRRAAEPVTSWTSCHYRTVRRRAAEPVTSWTSCHYRTVRRRAAEPVTSWITLTSQHCVLKAHHYYQRQQWTLSQSRHRSPSACRAAVTAQGRHCVWSMSPQRHWHHLPKQLLTAYTAHVTNRMTTTIENASIISSSSSSSSSCICSNVTRVKHTVIKAVKHTNSTHHSCHAEWIFSSHVVLFTD